MNLDWEIGITIGLVLCLTLGIWLLKDYSIWSWSLKRRAYLRNGIARSIMNIRSWEYLLERRKKSNPIDLAVRWVRSYREKKMDREIFESITFLRNLASIEKGKTSSSDAIIEKLSEHNGLLQPIFIRMLKLLRINQPKEAAAIFYQKVGTTASRDFAGLLLQWDRLESRELLETLLSYEKGMKAARLTDQKRKDEIISDLIYFPVVINILVIFINFIYVAYFLDQKEMLQMFI